MSVYQAADFLLANDYVIVSDKTSYPYGRHRGDISIKTVYKRKDGTVATDADIEVLKNRDIASSSRPMAALSGIYKTSLSKDQRTVTVSYYRHTAG